MGRFVGERWNKESLDGLQNFFPETGHYHYHSFGGEGLIHDGKVVIEISEKGLKGVLNVSICGASHSGRRTIAIEEV